MKMASGSNTDASTFSQDVGVRPTYTDRESRISKENLCMVLALRMEEFPVPQESGEQGADPYRKIGAVLVLPNDMLHAVDCTRNGVHGVARLLLKHYDVAKDCKIFVSRKPCSFCTKLLVQCKVKRVFYLPIEPEYKDVEEFKDEASRVDNLFKTSAISQSVFVPTVGSGVFENAEKRKKTSRETREKITKKLLESYWKEEWMEKAKDDLPWPAFDHNMKKQVRGDFENIMEWMARILIEEDKGYKFKAVGRNQATIPFDPERNLEGKQASHLITMAKFLAERSDDPKTGVGAVITNKALEIIALGFNGYLTKALYGEFPRGSDHDIEVQDKKYPYVVHAEQNALLMRNTKNLQDGILFVTKTPCDECTPLLEMAGIKTVVLGVELQRPTETPSGNRLSYSKFFKKANNDGVFICFEAWSGYQLRSKSTEEKMNLTFRNK